MPLVRSLGAGRGRAAAGCAAALLAALPAGAQEPGAVEPVGDWAFSVRQSLSLGASWRTAARDRSLIGKTSLDRELCSPDDCLAVRADDTEPNTRFLRAPGALSSNTDDGDLNFERGDLVATASSWRIELAAERGPWSVVASGLAFYDPLNDRLRQAYPNRMASPGPQPGAAMKTRRGPAARSAAGHDAELLGTYLRYGGLLADAIPLELSLGRQTLPWGVAALATQGTLNFVNPPEVNRLLRPGAALTDAFQPLGMALARLGPLPGGWSIEAFRPYEWRPYAFPAKGSLQSFFDAGNEVDDDDHVVGLFAKTPNDPDQLGTPADQALASVSATSFSLRRAANRAPRGGGEFGVAAYVSFDGWGDSAELGFYHARYHSRLPALSAYAAPASCTRREGNANGRDTASGLEFLSDCGVPAVDRPGTDFEALPVEGARWFLEYPERVRLYGLSLNVESGRWVFQAEAAYRPNAPVQVDMEDVLFAAVQPAFPRHDLDLSSIVPTLGGGLFVLPSSRRAAPDFISVYRGGIPGEVAPGAYIRGYERMKTVQGMLGLTRILGPGEWLGADQGALIAELQAIRLPDLPGVDRVQFEGPGTFTHASPGVADSGDALRINPLRNDGGYVTRAAWTCRGGVALYYADVLGAGWSLAPFLLLSQDVAGVGPGLAENFLEGRRIAVASLGVLRGPWRLDAMQLIHAGGGRRNVLRDRDQFSLALTLEFR